MLALCLLSLVLATDALAQVGDERGYRIGARDQILIRVDELPSLASEQVVGDDGTINLGVVGSIVAQGLTESELAESLRQSLLAQGLRKATVSVAVTQYRSRPVAVMGAVAEPGNHFVPGRASLLEVLLSVGGLTPRHGESIYIRRRADNGLSDRLEIPVRDLVEAADPHVNIPIFAGDMINVPQAREITIHFLGEVANAGSFTFTARDRPTLLTAIARAGGMTEAASNKIAIQRADESGTRTEITADFKRLLAGKAPDIPLQDGDLIVVRESFF